MGWAHGEVTMEEMLGLVRGFVDILVLAGGRTSSGTAATWLSGDVKKALRWALFFEEVFKNLRDSGQYEDSARELDAALVELTSSPDFPKGLADMQSETVSTARELVLKHFLKARTTSVENFGAVLEAVVEMDIDGICGSGERNACQEYVRSIINMNSTSLMRTKNACDVGVPTSSDELYAESLFMGHSRILVKELLKGLDSASCISLAERGLGTLLNSLKKSSFDDAGSTSSVPAIPKKSQMIDEFLLWKQWRGKCLSYLFDERTIRIMSGANLIFSAPKEQWMRVFDPLKVSTDSFQSGLVEIMELCLLGLVSRRWNPLIESFMSHTFSFFPISKQYADLHQLLQGTSQDECQDKLLDFKEKDILEYARQALESKPYILWLLPPVLTAAAMLPRSTLFEIYLAEIDKEFDKAVSTNRKCNCSGDGIEQHRNCDKGDSQVDENVHGERAPWRWIRSNGSNFWDQTSSLIPRHEAPLPFSHIPCIPSRTRRLPLSPSPLAPAAFPSHARAPPSAPQERCRCRCSDRRLHGRVGSLASSLGRPRASPLLAWIVSDRVSASGVGGVGGDGEGGREPEAGGGEARAQRPRYGEPEGAQGHQ